MDLYVIKVTHYAPKGSREAINEYVVAENNRQVFEYLAKGYARWECILEEWEDYYDSKEDAVEEYEQIYKYKCDCRDLHDLYYGATRYSWEKVELVNDKVIDLMIENKLAKVIGNEVEDKC
jgi:hypothetical protein